MVEDDGSDIISCHINVPSNGVGIGGGSAMDFLTRMELDLAYSSEKVLNLEILMMQVSELASDYEILMKGPDELLIESIEKAFQFDILSGFLNSEMKEIESFMSNLQLEIMDAYKKFTKGDHLEDFLLNIEATLHLAEESLRNSQGQMIDIRKQTDRFEKCLAFGISMLENGECSPVQSKWKLQTVEQQRHFLLSLERSLAREMDFEKKLSESRHNEEELKSKLQFAEKNVYYFEELIEEMMAKMFTAEYSVEVILGSLKEFMGKFQNGHFNFSTSTALEWEGKSNMEKTFMKLSADPKKSRTMNFGLNGFPMPSEFDLRTNFKESTSASSAVSVLGERVNVPEEHVRASETKLHPDETSIRESSNQHNILYTESSNLENTIESLNGHVLEMQSMAASAEAQYARLKETTVELNDEVGFLRNNGTEKTNFLEKKLKESNTQLEHANASLEAIEENQRMLYTSLSDMEHLIEGLKGKVSKAENRAENAEAKCLLLTSTNLELNEELSFLRSRLESLEASLHQADMEKIAAVKDIGSRTRIIIELVKKLAFERELLQLQIPILTNRNKILTEKLWRSESNIPVNYEEVNNSPNNISTKDESFAEALSTPSQVDESISSTIHEGKLDPAVSAADSVPNIELVRTIDTTQLDWKYILMAFILLLVSILSVFLFQLDRY